ncbi:MAG TPA: hypothetical protein VFT22_41080 [Kofleriaceae bacterium]|nr:hypothetical protein [Kofleriaceae bacterium]
MRSVLLRNALVVVLAAPLGLLAACVAQSDPAGETSAEQSTTTAASPTQIDDPAPLSSADENSSRPDPGLAALCSSCSTFECQTHSVGAACTVTGPLGQRQGFCFDTGNTCSTDGLPTCKCGTSVP